jgi:hypothetical protein
MGRVCRRCIEQLDLNHYKQGDCYTICENCSIQDAEKYLRDKTMKENKFCYHGRCFHTLDEMIEYGKNFPDMPFDFEWFKSWISSRIMEAVTNSQINPEMTNREAYGILRMSTDWVEKN